MAELRSLRIEDYSDRELLLIVIDLAGDGYVDPADVAKRLGIVAEHPVRSVISRFVWLWRYEVLEREVRTDEHGHALLSRSGKVRYGQSWRLTTRGRLMAKGRLTKAEHRALAGMGDEKMLLVTRWLGERQRVSEPVAGTLIRREYRYATSAQRATNGSRPT